MAEVLTHVLAAYVLATIISWGVAWLDQKWVAVAMIGAIFPDLNRLDMLVSADAIEAAIGLPFNWGALHTFGGVVLLAGIGALLFPERRQQVIAFGMLLFGALSHLVLDSLKIWADGSAGAYWYPVTWYRPPAGGLYVSADRWVVVVAVIAALIVFLVDRYLVGKDRPVEAA